MNIVQLANLAVAKGEVKKDAKYASELQTLKSFDKSIPVHRINKIIAKELLADNGQVKGIREIDKNIPGYAVKEGVGGPGLEIITPDDNKVHLQVSRKYNRTTEKLTYSINQIVSDKKGLGSATKLVESIKKKIDSTNSILEIGRVTKTSQPYFDKIKWLTKIDEMTYRYEATPAKTIKQMVQEKGEVTKDKGQWKLTLDEYVSKYGKKGQDVGVQKAFFGLNHRLWVQKAVREGKAVPQKVLEEYKAEEWAKKAFRTRPPRLGSYCPEDRPRPS